MKKQKKAEKKAEKQAAKLGPAAAVKTKRKGFRIKKGVHLPIPLGQSFLLKAVLASTNRCVTIWMEILPGKSDICCLDFEPKRGMLSRIGTAELNQRW